MVHRTEQARWRARGPVPAARRSPRPLHSWTRRQPSGTLSRTTGRSAARSESMTSPGGELAVLDGVLERVTFGNPETGYTIARIAPDRGTGRGPVSAGTELITAVGPLLGAQIGESLRLRGRWTSHLKYGRQFDVHSYTTVLPATEQGIRRYLGSGLIKGIGPVMAERMVEPLRRRHHARHRRRARPPDRGPRPRPEAHRADQGRLGRAEGDQGGHDLPAGRRRLHVAGGEDLQEVRRRVDRRPSSSSPTGWPPTSGASASRPPTRSPPRSASRKTAPSGSRPASPTPCPRPPTTATATSPSTSWSPRPPRSSTSPRT